eukprot:Blabericola_migrator_1__9015@NODE_47_length_16538_cov_123_101147_g43_i0_p10_GENE_NODE_47_length_16538_cov_123_101147_g43_i0NODE_47_length_16538_cov_123_101147_g43_i0_p10_ORF_typecomplete_len200_score26_62X/PF00739_19/0_079_NODE_47_length_16538_cov_123_101147_g43_i0130729
MLFWCLVIILTLVAAELGDVTIAEAESRTGACAACLSINKDTITLSDLAICAYRSSIGCKISFTITGSSFTTQCDDNNVLVTSTLLYNEGITNYTLSIATQSTTKCSVEVVETSACTTEGTSSQLLNITQGSKDTAILKIGSISSTVVLRSTDGCASKITNEDLSVSVYGTLYGQGANDNVSKTVMMSLTTAALGVLFL